VLLISLHTTTRRLDAPQTQALQTLMQVNKLLCDAI
jgi:hypothetical protein